MQIVERKQVGNVHVWAIDGGIDRTTHDEFIADMQRILNSGEKGTVKVVLDLTRLTYISSLGLGTLVRVHNRFNKAGAGLKFANLHTNVGSVLHFSHLDRVFDLYGTVDEAIKAFGQ